MLKAIEDEKIPQLKPCPCCGGKAIFTIGSAWKDEDETVQIVCQNEYCGIQTPKMYASKQDAYILKRDIVLDLVTAWNRREGSSEE